MHLRALTNGPIDGALSGTGVITVDSMTVGGVIITTDNSNAAAVVLRRENATGKVIFDESTLTTLGIMLPLTMEGTDKLYFSITGTGAKAMLYEWIE